MHKKNYKSIFFKWLQSRVGAMPRLPNFGIAAACTVHLQSRSRRRKLYAYDFFTFLFWLRGRGGGNTYSPFPAHASAWFDR